MPASFQEELNALKEKNLLRTLRVNQGPQSSKIQINGHPLLQFSSNDYLGLANDPALKKTAQEAIEQWGVGTGASRLLCGTQLPHQALEAELTQFKKTNACLTFSTGYAGAVGSLSALLGKQDIALMDKLCHASLIDGVRLSKAKCRVFQHNDLHKLEALLQWASRQANTPKILIITEAVFSMDGDQAPLAKIVSLKKKYGAQIFLDEAHSFGILGEQGRGLASQLNLADEIDYQFGTLGKAVGVAGAYLCAKKEAIDYLINNARSFIYSTAPPAAIAETARAAIQLIASKRGDSLRQKLQENITFFQKELQKIHPATTNPQSAIIPILLGSNEKALQAMQQLQAAGIYAPAIRYPTVPRDQARLRITLSAAHSYQQIEKLLRALKEILPPN